MFTQIYMGKLTGKRNNASCRRILFLMDSFPSGEAEKTSSLQRTTANDFYGVRSTSTKPVNIFSHTAASTLNPLP